MSVSRHFFTLRDHPTFFATAKKIRGSSFTLFFQTDLPYSSKVVCVVSKKNFSKAVARNQAKRQVRALLSPMLRAFPGKLIVVVNLYQPLESSSQKDALQATLRQILERLS